VNDPYEDELLLDYLQFGTFPSDKHVELKVTGTCCHGYVFGKLKVKRLLYSKF